MPKYTFRDLKDSLTFNISMLTGLFVVLLTIVVDVVEKIILGEAFWVRFLAFLVFLIIFFSFLKSYLSLIEIDEELDRVRNKKE